MNNTIKIALLAVLTLAGTSRAGEKIIYGEDGRADYYAMPENLKWAADSTVSLWKRNSMWLDQAAGSYKLATYNFGEGHDLCPDAKFREQPAGAFCSGALVGEDLVMTAGHCLVTEGDCASAAFVFGYALTEAGGKARTEISAGEVYTCSKIVKRQLLNVATSVDNMETTEYGPDYALVKLDRKVKGHKPLPINRGGGLKKGTPLFVTGHPVGLPFKFADNARVIKDIDKASAYFVTNLDTFDGNSGSPVFNAGTLLIEGIHVRGEVQHFVPTFEGCNTYLVRPPGTGYGGHVTKVDFPLTRPENRPLRPMSGLLLKICAAWISASRKKLTLISDKTEILAFAGRWLDYALPFF